MVLNGHRLPTSGVQVQALAIEMESRRHDLWLKRWILLCMLNIVYFTTRISVLNKGNVGTLLVNAFSMLRFNCALQTCRGKYRKDSGMIQIHSSGGTIRNALLGRSKTCFKNNNCLNNHNTENNNSNEFNQEKNIHNSSISGSSNFQNNLFVGFDLGTSGARVSVIRKIFARSNNLANDMTTQNLEMSKHSYDEIYSKSVLWGSSSSSSSTGSNINGSIKIGQYDDPNAWMDAIYTLFDSVKQSGIVSMKDITSICFSGTSASCVLARKKQMQQQLHGNTATQFNNEYNRPMDVIQPCRGNQARMYNYNVDNIQALNHLNQYAPISHTARSTTGSLAKLLGWHFESPLEDEVFFCHQADYVACQFLADHGSHQINNNHVINVDGIHPSSSLSIQSDWHNCLKLGFDVKNLQYPDWMIQCLKDCGIKSPESVLPNPVVSPGEVVGLIRADVTKFLGLSDNVTIVGGTTDSNAAFFAATASGMMVDGVAVTSLGSTLAIKQLSSQYIEDAARGVYSHRFPSSLLPSSSSSDTSAALWLVGGASNVGCAILRELNFSTSELEMLSNLIDPSTDSPLQYYPLIKKGERFPIADPLKEPVMEPIPTSRKEYLHGILQSISAIEKDGFMSFQELGVKTLPHTVYTCGGGSKNDMWIRMRQRILRQAFSSTFLSNNFPNEQNNDSTTATAYSDKNNIVVSKAIKVEASYGAAVLAAASFQPGLEHEVCFENSKVLIT